MNPHPPRRGLHTNDPRLLRDLIDCLQRIKEAASLGQQLAFSFDGDAKLWVERWYLAGSAAVNNPAVARERERAMSGQSEQLQELRAQLHGINQDWSRAAAPLERLSDLNDEQRKELAAELRAVQARWEDITRRIDQLLHIEDSYLKDAPE